jgi:hypothetical protein
LEACKSCGQQAEPDYSLPLCSACRESLSKRPLPKWVKLSFFLVILVTLFAATKFPKSLVAGIAFERGRLAEGSHDFSSAVANYSQVLNLFPNSILVIARLGIAQQKAGDFSASRETLGKIAKLKVSKEIAREVNESLRIQHREVQSLQAVILKSKEELASIENELKDLSDSLDSLKEEIDKTGSSLKAIDRQAYVEVKVDKKQYDKLIAKYNNLVSLYNQKLELRKSIYIRYKNKLQETNALIDTYNAIIVKK